MGMIKATYSELAIERKSAPISWCFGRGVKWKKEKTSGMP